MEVRPVVAHDDGPRVTAALTGGTLGVGPELGLRISDHFGVRGSAAFLKVSPSFDSKDIHYDSDFKLHSYGAMADVYPFGGAFRISAGARINRTRVGLVGTPLNSTAEVKVGGQTYLVPQVGILTGRAEPKRFAPALTLGWAGKKRRGFFVGIEGGVLFQGSFQLKDFRASGPINSNAAFQTVLERERIDLQEDVDKVKVWPILQASVGWRF
ncbi:hypothetical protein QE363_003192 [Sphingomonas sp. SORGH_AS870]|nr:hypothetical protein [Sphingomonas sp. SORGH_AS_0870]